ncbi:hypothetical protein VPH35_086252 [Triticum aestivum]
MDDNTNTLKSLLKSIVTRLDEQKLDSDKRLEAQVAFNTQVSQDVRNLSKRIDLTQADVDEARKSMECSPSPRGSGAVFNPPPPPPLRPAPAPHHQGPPLSPRLADERPPLLVQSPAPAPAVTQAHMGVMAPHPQQQPDFNHHPRQACDTYIKPSKHDFPRFDGSAPYLWLDRCRAYFDLYRVPAHSWVTTTTLYIEGQAAHWLQAFCQVHQGLTWEAFCATITEEFGVDEFELEMHKLLQLRQNSTVAEYRQMFDTHIYHLLALDPSLSPKFFITQFLLGLKDEIRAAVRLQSPTSITRASILARIQEDELGMPRARPRPTPAGRPPPLPVPAPPRPVPTARPQGDEFARERQLKDFRHANGLCFKCGDRYSREHRCNTQAQLLTIQVGNYGELLSDDAIHALELLDEPVAAAPQPECCMLSAHALDDSDTPPPPSVFVL